MSNRPNPFVHVERELADAAGLHHDVIKKTRGARLKRGTDWDLVKGLVCYSDAGRDKLRAVLKISAVLPPRRRLVLPHGGEIGISEDVALFIGGMDSAPNTVEIDLTLLDWGKKYAAPVAGDRRMLQCVRTVKNVRIVVALDGTVEALVRVKSSKNFRAGMQIPAEFVDGSLWTFVGRLPRWPGKY